MGLVATPIIIGVLVGIPLGIFLLFKTPGIGTFDWFKRTKKAVPYLKFINPDKVGEQLKQEGIILGKNTRCSVCGRVVAYNNFGAMRRTGDEIIFVCSNPHCMNLGNIVTIK